jgi:hypothetical protein
VVNVTKQKTGFIYVLTFSDGKKYIGLTIRTPEYRICQHRYRAGRGRSFLYRAWRELGEPTMEVLLSDVPVSDLPGEEIRLIALHKTEWPGGYNTLPGGEMAPSANAVVAAKISKSRMGMVFSETHIRNLSISHKGKPSPKRGIPMSEEQKQKLRLAWVTRRVNHPYLDETRVKIGNAFRGRKGKVMSAEARQKMSIAKKAYWAAKKSNATSV